MPEIESKRARPRELFIEETLDVLESACREDLADTVRALGRFVADAGEVQLECVKNSCCWTTTAYEALTRKTNRARCPVCGGRLMLVVPV